MITESVSTCAKSLGADVFTAMLCHPTSHVWLFPLFSGIVALRALEKLESHHTYASLYVEIWASIARAQVKLKFKQCEHSEVVPRDTTCPGPWKTSCSIFQTTRTTSD